MIEAAEAWDQSRAATLSTLPELMPNLQALRAGFPRPYTAEEFERLKRSAIDQYRTWLSIVETDERLCNCGATGWDIERRLVDLATQMRRPRIAGSFHGEARSIEDGFSVEQRGRIYGWLVDLTQIDKQLVLDQNSLWEAVLSEPAP